jgi:hypothetical protein
MKRLLLALAIFFPVVARAESFWQITFRYDARGPSEILAAQQIPPLQKSVSHPGRLSAAELHRGVVTWTRDGETLSSQEIELPIGDRFASVQPSVGVIRVAGPDSWQTGDLIAINLLGQTTRGAQVSTRAGLQPLRSGTLRFFVRGRPDYHTLDGPISVHKVADNGGDANRFVIVILGDGYRVEDIQSGLFDQDVQNAVEGLVTQSPWDRLRALSNVYSVSVVSNEAGADEPCAAGADPDCVAASRDTYFNTTFGYFGSDRLLSPDGHGQARAFAVADQQVGPGVWDILILLVNSDKYGGSGGSIPTASRSSSELVVHELGHSIAGLADEYSDPYPGYPDGTPEPNVDSDPLRPKWWRWLTSGVPLPTPDTSDYGSVVGAFEGARYKSSGVYRPVQSCKMRLLGVPFCPVCKEALSRVVLGQVQIIDATIPSSGVRVTVGRTKRKFVVTPVSFGSAKVAWTLCGKSIRGKRLSIGISRSNMRRKSCELKGTLTTTSSLIQEGTYQQTVQWTVRRK